MIQGGREDEPESRLIKPLYVVEKERLTNTWLIRHMDDKREKTW
jgi:hypothetical protein